MDFDLIKQDLLEIIKEAQNLDQSELGNIAGTSIYVKKSREDEFRAKAYLYFEHLNNGVRLEANLDKVNYVDTVYKELVKEIREENQGYYESKSMDIAMATNSEIKRLQALEGSLTTINSNYQKVTKDLQNALKMGNAQEIKRLNDEVTRLLENRNIITTQIIEIKNKVNDVVKKTIKEQMDLIIDSYHNTRRGTKIAFGLDGKSILESDKEQYDSLYVLGQILDNVKDEDIVVIDNFICVNSIQKETVEDLLKKIEVFKRLKVVPKQEEEVKRPNDILIEKITAELRRLEGLGAGVGKSFTKENFNEQLEYNNLLEILKILNKANDSKYALNSVWDIAEVLREDQEHLIDLFNRTKLFNSNNNSLHKMTEENLAMVEELEKYLDNLALNISKEAGVSNLPIRETIKIGDRSWVVLEKDVEEANRIIEIMNLLTKTSDKMVEVWGIGNVHYEDVPKFKKLINATKYFESKVPVIDVNQAKIEEVKKSLTELIRHAKENPGPMAQNGLVLQSDEEKYKLLNAQYNYLQAAAGAQDLEDVDGVKIESQHVAKYKEVVERLKALDNPELTGGREPVSNPTLDEKEKSEPIKRGVGKVRKLTKTKAIDFIKKHWKLIVASGLAIGAMAIVLPGLPEAIIFANSCNVINASPLIQWALNSISTLVGSVSGIGFNQGAWVYLANGQMITSGAAASKGLGATLNVLARLGVIGASFVGVKKVAQMNENKMTEQSRLTLAKDEIKKVMAKVREKALGIGLKSDKFIDKAKEAVGSAFSSPVPEDETMEDIRQTVDEVLEEKSVEPGLATSLQKIEERAQAIEVPIVDDKEKPKVVVPSDTDLLDSILQSSDSISKPVKLDEELLDSIIEEYGSKDPSERAANQRAVDSMIKQFGGKTPEQTDEEALSSIIEEYGSKGR